MNLYSPDLISTFNFLSDCSDDSLLGGYSYPGGSGIQCLYDTGSERRALRGHNQKPQTAGRFHFIINLHWPMQQASSCPTD